MVLPGPEAQQLATYIGWLLHRTWGGLIAGGLFVLPSLGILVALSWIYVAFGTLPAWPAPSPRVKPAVVAIIVQAAHRLGTPRAEDAGRVGDRGLSFAAMVAAVPFPILVGGRCARRRRSSAGSRRGSCGTAAAHGAGRGACGAGA